MAATVTCGKLAAAFMRGDGTVIYALFESTFERNVFPRIPHWSCIAIGGYADVMLQVFRHATSCEGGMLKSANNRDLKPENYIAGWQRELAEPVLLDDFNIVLEVGHWRLPIDAEKLDETVSALRQVGRDELAEAVIANSKPVISLYGDVDVVLALYGVGKVLPPWSVLKHAHAKTLRRPELGMVGRTDDINSQKVGVLALKGGVTTQFIVQVDGGAWQSWEADYSALGKYMMQVVYPCEMKKTGSHKRMIADFRSICENAFEVHEDTRLKLFRNTKEASQWNNETFDKLIAKLGGMAGAVEYQCTIADLKAVEHGLTELQWLNKSQVVWEIPPQSATWMASQMSLLPQAA